MSGTRPADYRLSTVPVVLGLTIGVVLLAILPWGIGFYSLVRVLATAGIAWVIFAGKTYETSPLATIALAVVGLVFNPIFPVYAGRAMWVVLDIAAAGTLGWVWMQLRGDINRRLEEQLKGGTPSL